MRVDLWPPQSAIRQLHHAPVTGRTGFIERKVIQMKLLNAALLLTALACSPAHAQQGPIATQCKAEITNFCEEFSHIRGAVRLCLEENRQQVSAPCSAALDAAGPRNRQQIQGGIGLRRILDGLSDLGYTNFGEIEREQGHYELDATNPEGRNVEVYVDARTGEVLRSKPED